MATTVKNNFDAVRDYLNDLSVNNLVNTYNEYVREHRPDDEIYLNDDDFFEVYFSKAVDAVRAVFYGDYRYCDEYVIFNGYGNLESFNDPSEHIDIEELTQAILDDPNNFYDIELEDDDEETEEQDTDNE